MNYYANEKNQLLLISLLKQHGIRYVVASPGGTNLSFVASLQQDPFFKIYSCVDERSAAYLACGISEETGEPVVISCTGATASRNYMPGLTEAYYRKLPILAVTAAQEWGNVGQLVAQCIDRTALPNDIVVESANIPVINSANDEWASNVRINQAILALTQNGGGPVHINLAATWSDDFSVKELKTERKIERFTHRDVKPAITDGKVAIFVGAHKKMSKELISAIESFCERYNAVVFVDHTSNYDGKYKIHPGVFFQDNYVSENVEMDLLIHIGDVSGAYYRFKPKKVWRVNLDGAVRDYFRKLVAVFQMDEAEFFNYYVSVKSDAQATTYYDKCADEYASMMGELPEMPFSNLWIGSQICPKLPANAQLHLAILNSLRTWNYFEKPEHINCFTNTGGFGIEGGVSSAIGASLVAEDKVIYCVVGDLAFFYDLNSIGNRHIKNNIRIILVNNGRGTEFKNYWTVGSYALGEETDKFIAAAGHFGNQSRNLVKDYAQDLGFEYICATDKESFLDKVDYFTQEKATDKPILFEVFTTSQDESDALHAIRNMKKGSILETNSQKQLAKNLIGEKNINKLKMIKKIIKD